MKLKHELPTELDTFFTVESNIDMYLEQYEEELLTDEELEFINNYFNELYNEQEQRENQEWSEVCDTRESLRYI